MARPPLHPYIMPQNVPGLNRSDSVDADLQFARAAFGEKVKELSVAVARVDALTKQLEELKRGNTHNSYQVFANAVPANSSKLSQEYEKLRQQLLHGTNLVDKHTTDLAMKQSLLNKKKQELQQIDERISELQQRISKKKQLNQELTMQIESSNKPTGQFIGYNSPLRNSIGPGVPGFGTMSMRRLPQSFPRSNIAAVEPMQRMTTSDQDKVNLNHHSDKYITGKEKDQSKISSTLPHDLKIQADSINQLQNSSSSSPWRETEIIRTESSIEVNKKEAKAVSVDEKEVTKHENNNSLTHTTNVDWQKAKRRPVIVDDDIERALSDPSSDQMVASFSPNFSPNKQTKSEPSDHTSLEVEIIDDPDGGLMSKGKVRCDDLKSQSSSELQVRNSTSTATATSTTSKESIESTNECQLPKSKGSLKQLQANESKKNSATNLTRRVSFDPLALLLDAALEGELELVKKTASQVPDPSDVKDEGITALHNAICAGHFPIVEYLVSIGCDVNAQDSDGWTPLHCAASCNNFEMVKFLVEHGACVFATTFSDGETAAEKCEEDEAGFDHCSKYLYDIQDQMGIANDGLVYAVYDYDAHNEDELSFNDGDDIIVLRKGDTQEMEWWWSLIGEREGYVPRNLLGVYPRVQIRGRMAQKAQKVTNDDTDPHNPSSKVN